MSVLDDLRIVASQSMHTGATRMQSVGPWRGPISKSLQYRRARAGSAGPGGTWVYVSLPNGCVAASPELFSEGPWRNARASGIRGRDAYRRLVPGVAGEPDVLGIVAAIEQLRTLWAVNLPVDWRVITCTPQFPGQLQGNWQRVAVPCPERFSHAP